MVGYDPAQRVAFYHSLLTTPGERGGVDYKASMKLGRRDSNSLKLLRHILGMANSGGGTIVIGYKEDQNRRFIPDPDHNDKICQSYDTTELANRMNSLVRETDEKLVVYVNQVVHPETGLTYPIVQVEGFTKRPFFCRSGFEADDTREEILTPGIIYIRRPNAETTPLSHPDDWNTLIDQCVQTRRDEFLRQFEDLLGQMGLTITPRQTMFVSPSEWISEMRSRATGVQS